MSPDRLRFINWHCHRGSRDFPWPSVVTLLAASPPSGWLILVHGSWKTAKSIAVQWFSYVKSFCLATVSFYTWFLAKWFQSYRAFVYSYSMQYHYSKQYRDLYVHWHHRLRLLWKTQVLINVFSSANIYPSTNCLTSLQLCFAHGRTVGVNL